MGSVDGFAHLETEAAALGAELNGAAPGAPGAAPGATPGAAPGGAAPAPSALQLAARDVRAMLEIMQRMLKPISPAAADVYTEQVMIEVSESVGAVLVKHNLNLFGLLGRFEVEIKCAIVIAPVAWATVAAIRDTLEAKAAAAARPLNAQPEQRTYPNAMYS